MNDLDKFLLFVALPFVVFASLVEAVVLARRSRFDWRALGVSLVDLVGRIGMQIFVPFTIAYPVMAWAYSHRLSPIALDGWQALLALFLAQEFCYYWYHRAAHRVRWFWCNHSVHHSPNELNLSGAYRIGIFSRVSGVALFFVPMVWLGFPPKVVFQTLSINLLYQFWIHATWIPKLGGLEWVFNTPSAHRVHHAANVEYLDANYGGVLIVFDRLFGTYRAERADLPCRYGLVQPFRGYNIVKLEVGQWLAMFNDVWRARSFKAGLGAVFMPPGWRADGQGSSTDDLRRAAAAASASASASASAAPGMARTTPPTFAPTR